MRRMLDPKEVGGSTPERHGYMITISDDFWFLSFSTKDYGFKIGKENDKTNDFFTDSYKDLRSIGYHTSGGLYKGSSADIIVCSTNIYSSTNLFVRGYNQSTNTMTTTDIKIQNRPIKIIQLF